MTYAYYIPSNYSLERFQRGELDYARSSVKGSEIEIWGLPENVRKGLDVHNTVLRELGKGEGVLFVDQQALLGNEPKNFIDVCHLSPAGMEQFVQHILAELLKQGWGTHLSDEFLLQRVPTQGPRSQTTGKEAGTEVPKSLPATRDAIQPYASGALRRSRLQ